MNLSTFDAFKRLPEQDGIIRVEGKLLEQLQHVLRDMLADIVRVCEAEHIDYVLGGGTCLGAIRHHGFIPWDDDVDINMTREGYQRLRPALLKAYPGKYVIQDPQDTEGYDLCFPRVRLCNTVFRCRDDFDDGECGVYVDIFLIEDVPNNAIARKLHGLGSLAIGLGFSCRRFYEHAAAYLKLAADDEEIVRVFRRKISLGRLCAFASAKSWTRAWDRWNGLWRVPGSTYVSIPVGRKHYFGETYRRNDILPGEFADFEGLEVRVPRNVEAYLGQLYGPDYMKLPPEDERETHVVYEVDLGDAGDER